jgi:hypothetical protein
MTKWMNGLAEYPELDDVIKKHIEKNKDIKVIAEDKEPEEDWE